MLGLVISPRTKSSYLGYERSDAKAPKMLAVLLRWRHRGTFLAGWEDVARVATDHVTLRPGYTRYSPVLRDTEWAPCLVPRQREPRQLRGKFPVKTYQFIAER